MWMGCDAGRGEPVRKGVAFEDWPKKRQTRLLLLGMLSCLGHLRGVGGRGDAAEVSGDPGKTYSPARD